MVNLKINKEMIIWLIIIFFVALSIFWIVYWWIRYVNETIRKQGIIIKYYNIILAKFSERNPANIYLVSDDDIDLFNKKEIKSLIEYIDEQNNLRKFLKGRSKIIGEY